MARDFNNQFQGAYGDVRDYGELTLDANGEAACTTYLRAVRAAFASHKAAATGLLVAGTPISCSCVISTAGTVTFIDAGGPVNAGGTISYLLIGHR